MKKYISLFLCTIISFAFLVGCGNQGNSNQNIGTENKTEKTDPSKLDETTDWKPTKYETVNNFEGVTMAVKDGIASSTGSTVILKNKSSNQFIYGEYFSLEKKSNGSWYQVPAVIENYGFDAIGHNLASGEDSEWTVDWKWLYGSLSTGEYRIVKDILKFKSPGKYDTYYFAAEFAISKEINESKEKLGIRGEITKVSLNDSGKITGILVEGKVEQDTVYDKASVYIGDQAKIYKNDTKEELERSALKEGLKVEIIFKGMVRESYPVQADAKIIRVME